MANQLVDSKLTTTREWWRREFFKLSEEIVTDPRPIKEIYEPPHPTSMSNGDFR
jgi:hypothetical protein